MSNTIKVRFRKDDWDVDVVVPRNTKVPRGWYQSTEDTMLEGVMVICPRDGAEDAEDIDFWISRKILPNPVEKRERKK